MGIPYCKVSACRIPKVQNIEMCVLLFSIHRTMLHVKINTASLSFSRHRLTAVICSKFIHIY